MEVVPVLLLSPTVTVTVEYDARVVPVSSNRGQPRWLVESALTLHSGCCL